MRAYASAAYVSLIVFITQIEHQLHARKVDVQVWTSDARMLKGDARMLRDDEDSPYTGKQLLLQYLSDVKLSLFYYSKYYNLLPLLTI